MYFSRYKSKKHSFFTFLSVFQSLDKLLPSATRPERTLSSVHSAGGQIDGEKKSARRHFNFRKRETLFCNSLPPAKRKDCASTYISNQERKAREKKKNAFFVLLQSQSTETIVADDGDDREENDDEHSSSIFVFVYVD